MNPMRDQNVMNMSHVYKSKLMIGYLEYLVRNWLSRNDCALASGQMFIQDSKIRRELPTDLPKHFLFLTR